MTHELEKSDPPKVARKLANAGVQLRGATDHTATGLPVKLQRRS